MQRSDFTGYRNLWTSWSECVARGKKVQNGEPVIIDQIKTVERVCFGNPRPSEGEIQAVKEMMGIVQYLETVWLKDCNLCEDPLRIPVPVLHDVFKEVEIDTLYIFRNTNIGVEGWYYIGRIVLQSRVKELFAFGCDVTDECLESFMQGMDGAQLDIFDISCNPGDSKNVDFINVLLKILPLIRGKLQLYKRELLEDQKVEVQKKLDKDCHKSLTIMYGNRKYLKASPMKLASILPDVEGVKARNTNGSVWLEWDPLSITNISYHIIVEDVSSKAVGEPIVISSTGTSCQLSSLESNKRYYFFIWGFTDDGISKRVAGIHHFTGKITGTKQSPEPSTSLNKRKRTGDVVDTGASKGKKRKGKKGSPKEGSTLNSWLATEGQYESPVGSRTSANEELAMVLSNDAVERKRNPTTQQKSRVAIPRAPNMMENRVSVIENTQTNFQQVIERLEEDNRRQGEKIIKQDKKIATLIKKVDQMLREKESQAAEIAVPKQLIQRTSTASQDENRSEISFTLPMNSDQDVKENEKLLKEKQNGTKLVESLSDVVGDGKEAVWGIMEKLFSNALAQTYSWTGRKGKKPICKLKMAQVIYRASIAKNVNNKDCKVAARRWLKNASDRDGGWKRRAMGKKKPGKSGAGPSK